MCVLVSLGCVPRSSITGWGIDLDYCDIEWFALEANRDCSVQGVVAARAERSYSTFKVRRGDLVQGKEQWLCFAGAAMKRYPTSKVRETQVRQ